MELELEENVGADPSAVGASEEEIDHSVCSEVHPERKSFIHDCLFETRGPKADVRESKLGTDTLFNQDSKQTFNWGDPTQNGSYSIFDLEKGVPMNAFALGPNSICESASDDVISLSDIIGDPFLLKEAKASLSREKAKASVSKKTTPVASPLECGACGKVFLQKHSLIRHLRLHTGERPFACHVCGKAFAQKNSLDSHMRVHTGERPFVCHVCGKGHTKDNDLKRHIRTHTGEKPYACDVCKKAFTQSAHLRVHLRMHSNDKPFACGVCGKTFTRNTHLKVHMFSHTKEKRFACDKCDRAFSLNSHLTRHQRTHTGERPFVCDVCEKAFFRRDRMKQHLRNHHAKEIAAKNEDR